MSPWHWTVNLIQIRWNSTRFLSRRRKRIVSLIRLHSLIRLRKFDLPLKLLLWMGILSCNIDIFPTLEDFCMRKLPFGETPAKTMAKIELCRGWAPWPSASATYRQTGWGLLQRGWSNDAGATSQRRPRHELAWNWTDFLSEQRWVSDLFWTGVVRAAKTAYMMLVQDSR